jgi:hypothetical protein
MLRGNVPFPLVLGPERRRAPIARHNATERLLMVVLDVMPVGGVVRR